MYINKCAIKPSVTPLAKALDIGFFDANICFFVLDESSYIWGYGNSGKGGLGEGSFASIGVSTPVAVTPDRKYVSLIQHGAGALDSFSYAWVWGNNSYGQLGINYSGFYCAAPRSVVGGKQWNMLVAGSTSFITMYVGLDSSSYAWSWGYNTGGILGDNTTEHRSSPVSVVGGKQFIKISAGGDGTVCGLDSSSYAWAWGNNNNGQLGNASIVNTSSPVSVVGNKQFISVDVGNQTVVALDGSSYAWGWGTNTTGQLGNGTILHRSSPTSVLSSQWNKIFVQGQCVFGLKDDGVYLCGSQAYGVGVSPNVTIPTKIAFPILAKDIKKIIFTRNSSLSNLAVVDNYSYVWAWGNIPTLQRKPLKIFPQQTYSFFTPPQSFIKITNVGASNQNPTYFIDTSSYAWCWGTDNSYGEMGIGFNEKVNVISTGLAAPYVAASSPMSVIGNIRFRDLYASGSFGGAVVGLDLSSYAWMWGPGSGVCGNNRTTTGNSGNSNYAEYSPVSVVGDRQWIKVIVDGTRAFGIDSSSYLWAWGNNVSGQLGLNSNISTSSPVSVVGGRQVLKVANSSVGTSFIDNSSFLWTFGTNVFGDRTNNPRSSPVSVHGGRRFIDIQGTQYNYYGLDESSYMWAWGFASSGELGNNTLNRSSPVSVVGNRQFLPNRTFANSSATSMVALDASSYAWVWGDNSNGQLGNYTVTNSSSPISVIGGFQFNYIEMGGFGLLGTNTYPASQYVCCGATYGGQRYGIEGVAYGIVSFPFLVNFGHTYVKYPTTTNKKNIVGKIN